MSSHTLEEIFHPQSIAVVGASGNPNYQGYAYTHHLIEYGYKGKIYPVNPKYPEILGMKAYPTLTDIPDSVDYVISCVPAGDVLSLLDECTRKEVKVVHLYTARFSETGRQDAPQERTHSSNWNPNKTDWLVESDRVTKPKYNEYAERTQECQAIAPKKGH